MTDSSLPASNAADTPDGDGSHPAGLPWVIYAVSAVAAAVAISDFFVGISGKREHLSGSWLFAAMVAPLVIFSIIIGYQGRRFASGLVAVSERFGQTLTANNDEIQQLTSQLKSEQTYADFVRQLSTITRDISQRVVRHEAVISEGELGQMLREVCRGVAHAFDIAKGQATRVCIKQITEKEGDQRPYVKTVCRSNKLSDDDATRWHPVQDNTDFDELFTERGDSWFCDDIDNYPGYKNSSVGQRPYRSVIVWPIVARTGRSDVESHSSGYDVAAFLCLDVATAGAFDQERDVPLGWGLADALGKAFEAHYYSFANLDNIDRNGGAHE